MKNYKIIAVIIALAGAAFTVVSALLLPQTVITQLSLGGSGVTTMPKIIAVAVPALLSLGGSAAAFLAKDNENTVKRALIVALVGILVFALTLYVNLNGAA